MIYINKYKICVYAICKNEEKFVKRWYESMKEADSIYVLDTGSTDNTVSLLKEYGVNVETKIINPWRFDVARNESLKLVPDDFDICVCTDLDEVLNKGWRSELENIWNTETTRCRYIYNWSLDKDNNPLITFYYEKIHSRNNYEWIYPVHEILKSNQKEQYVTTNNIILNHYPDVFKSRSNYLNLLKLAVKENPKSDRNMHYLGREYMYHKKYNKAIDILIKHLNMKEAIYKEERGASIRYISRCYIKLNRLNEAKMWLKLAIKETPYLREPYTELGIFYFNQKNMKKAIKYLNKALDIKERTYSYTNESFCYDNTIYDILSICYFNIGNYIESLNMINKALMYNEDERIKNNKNIVLSIINTLVS